MLASDSETVGGSVSGRAAADGPQLEAADVPEPAAAHDRAAHRRVAVHASVGPHRIAYHLQLHRSTVGRVLTRYGMPKLTNIDQATGLPVRKPKPKRYEVASPGQLVHVDIKKQGRIPDGGGWRVHGRGSVQDRAAGVARGRAARAPARRAPTATATCTMPWTITHGWRTRRSSTTNARRPRPGSGLARTRSSPASA